MKLNLTLSAAIVGALALASAPAFADDRGHRSQPAQQSQGDRGHAVERQRADAPRAEAPRAQPSRVIETPRVESPRVIETQRAQSRVIEAPRAQSPRVIETPRTETRRDDSNGRQYDNRQYNGRQYDNRQSDNRQYNGRQYDNRQSDNRQYDNRGRTDGRRDLGRAVPRDERTTIAPRYYGSGGYYRPYEFRARTRINFGIFLGYPVPYSYYEYPYPVPVYGYGRPGGPVIIGPGTSYYGGVSLEISPSDAEVFVDGQYAGVVRDFDGTQQPLTLTAGSHRLDVRAPGYEPLAMDVNVNPGEVVPYRGDLQPSRY
jgi:hypothetical protein